MKKHNVSKANTNKLFPQNRSHDTHLGQIDGALDIEGRIVGGVSLGHVDGRASLGHPPDHPSLSVHVSAAGVALDQNRTKRSPR